MTWSLGEIIARREVNFNRPTIAWPVYVVSDEPDLLVTFTPTHAPFSYSAQPFGATGRAHPWWPKSRWEGHGVLMLQRPGDAYAVWHFWSGEERTFSCWYLNLQDPFRRTTIGFDTGDHELDLVIEPSGQWHFKDAELLRDQIRDGRFSDSEGQAIFAQGDALAGMIEAGTTWWDPQWSRWFPPPTWATPSDVPAGWDDVPWQ